MYNYLVLSTLLNITNICSYIPKPKIKQFTYTFQACYFLTLRYKFQPTIRLSHGLDLPPPTRMPVTTMIVLFLNKGIPNLIISKRHSYNP